METGKLGVLVDSDALISLIQSDNNQHKLAKTVLLFLKEKNADQYISPFTIPEVSTMLSYRANQEIAKQFVISSQSKKLTTLEIPEEIRRKADQLFLAQTKKRTSYFDCVNLVLMELFRFDAIFSFDSIYKEHGFKLASDLL